MHCGMWANPVVSLSAPPVRRRLPDAERLQVFELVSHRLKVFGGMSFPFSELACDA